VTFKTPECPPVVLSTPSKKRNFSPFNVSTKANSAALFTGKNINPSRQNFHAIPVETSICFATHHTFFLGRLLIVTRNAPTISSLYVHSQVHHTQNFRFLQVFIKSSSMVSLQCAPRIINSPRYCLYSKAETTTRLNDFDRNSLMRHIWHSLVIRSTLTTENKIQICTPIYESSYNCVQ
jgi:hypothetical protein